MRLKGYVGLIAIFFVSILVPILLVSAVIAKSVEPNPGPGPLWPTGAIWGTNLRFENTDNALIPPTNAKISQIWWGVGGASDSTIVAPPDPTAGLIVEFLDSAGTNYFEWVKAAVAEPASYTWQVQFRTVKAADPNGGKVSSSMGDSENDYVPQDFSIVLENLTPNAFVDNSGRYISRINLRAGSDNVTGPNIRLTPILADLNVDNAVNVTISRSSRGGITGSNLSFTVTVNNTGRYDDNYSLGVDASGLSYIISPSSLSINAGSSATATLIVTVGTENKVITVTANGTYASANASCTVTVTAEQQYILTTSVDPTNSGSVTLNPAGVTYASDTTVTVTANPASGYEFDHWSGDASGTTTSVTENMNYDKNIIAHFRTTSGVTNGGLPWTWIVLGIVIVIIIIIIIAAIAATHRRGVPVLRTNSRSKRQTDTNINTTDLFSEG